jgi:CoA:oxalate CoA-transferase
VERSGPFADVTVLDLSRVLAGPYCTMLLADLGARVIKVERPGAGDDARGFGPFLPGGHSAYFASLNRGKESIALDLKAEADRAIFEALLVRADVLVENFRPGTLERLGYGWQDLAPRFPRLVYAAVSGFGASGPYAARPAYDVIAQAMGGIMSLTGHPGGPPTRVGTSIGDIAAGLFAAIGISAALHRRSASGRGTKVDVAMLDAQVAILENAIARYLATGEVPGPLGSRHPSIAPFAAFAAADGHLVLAAGNDGLFKKLCAVLGRPGLAADPRFASNEARVRGADALRAELESALAARRVAQWLPLLEDAGVPCGPIQDVAQVLADPQVAARNMVIRAGGARMAGNPVKLSAFPDPSQRAPAPELDQHRDSILRELARSPSGPGSSN